MPLTFKIVFVVLPFLSAFFFPYTVTLALAFAAGIVFPPLALTAGIFLDVLYYPGGWLVGTIAGLLLMAVTHLVRQFVKTRIM